MESTTVPIRYHVAKFNENEENPLLRFEHVLEARTPISGALNLTPKKTPLIQSEYINQLLKCDLYFKCEHLQHTGSFKVRGVLNWFRLNGGDVKEVVTFSSGNHGLALSWAAQKLGVPASVFVPENLSARKKEGMLRYGATLIPVGTSVEARRDACQVYAAKKGASLVPPFEGEEIIAGQGTIALEIVEELPLFDAVLVPVGGGGLCSGVGIVLRALRPHSRLIGCEPETGDDFYQSFAAKTLIQNSVSPTMAEGLRHASVGQLNWKHMKNLVSEVKCCSERKIVEAFQILANETKQVVEPSGAVAFASLLEHVSSFQGKKVVVILSGGNATLKDLACYQASVEP
ncbi:MAG: serine dehydratase [Acidobacteria bacterium]|nr:MAG: serine dehydratase [Acidobacteriota bacterium]